MVGDHQVSFNLGSLPAQTVTTTMLVTFMVDPSLANVGSTIQNKAQIATITVDAPITNNSAVSEEATIRLLLLHLVRCSDYYQVQDATQAYPGGKIVYTISYSNAGDQAATAVQLTDLFPASLSYSGNDANLAADLSVSGQATFNLGTLAAHSSGTMKITFVVSSNAAVGSTVQNQSTIRTASPEASRRITVLCPK